VNLPVSYGKKQKQKEKQRKKKKRKISLRRQAQWKKNHCEIVLVPASEQRFIFQEESLYQSLVPKQWM
jgi:hypothetical protein